jgi:hypothetical protein
VGMLRVDTPTMHHLKKSLESTTTHLIYNFSPKMVFLTQIMYCMLKADNNSLQASQR